MNSVILQLKMDKSASEEYAEFMMQINTIISNPVVSFDFINHKATVTGEFSEDDLSEIRMIKCVESMRLSNGMVL